MGARVPELPPEGALLPNDHRLPAVILVRYKVWLCLSHHEEEIKFKNKTS